MILKPSLLALALGGFGIGTTEFVVMGLLPQVAGDLGVTIPQAGLIVSGYATGVVIGAPILAILTATLPRKGTLLALMALFSVGNLLCAVAPTYGLMIAARIATAFAHAAFFGIGAIVAADLVPRGQRAQAMALMFAGLTLANVLGVPGGTALGQAVGWRWTFVAVAGIGGAALLALAAFVPRVPHLPSDNILREFVVLRSPQVLLGMAMSALSAASLFSTFTYITPLLTDVTGIPAAGVTLVLLLFGVGLTVGNFIGGRLADWRLMPSLIVLFAGVAIIEAIFTVTCHAPVPAIITMFVWGVLVFAVVSPLQMRVVEQARRAPNLASTLNQGGFNVGCASGAFLGALPITHGFSYAAIPWVGSALATLALALCLLSAALDGRRLPAVAPSASFR